MLVSLLISWDGVNHGLLGFDIIQYGRWLPQFLSTFSVFCPEEGDGGFLGKAVSLLPDYML
jgi:hypothetical protein